MRETGVVEKADRHGWLPIASAPKDGRDILGFRDGTARVVRWDDSEYSGEGGCWRANIHSFVKLDPTHWQPIPEPPEAA